VVVAELEGLAGAKERAFCELASEMLVPSPLKRPIAKLPKSPAPYSAGLERARRA